MRCAVAPHCWLDAEDNQNGCRTHNQHFCNFRPGSDSLGCPTILVNRQRLLLELSQWRAWSGVNTAAASCPQMEDLNQRVGDEGFIIENEDLEPFACHKYTARVAPVPLL